MVQNGERNSLLKSNGAIGDLEAQVRCAPARTLRVSRCARGRKCPPRSPRSEHLGADRVHDRPVAHLGNFPSHDVSQQGIMDARHERRSVISVGAYIAAVVRVPPRDPFRVERPIPRRHRKILSPSASLTRALPSVPSFPLLARQSRRPRWLCSGSSCSPPPTAACTPSTFTSEPPWVRPRSPPRTPARFRGVEGRSLWNDVEEIPVLFTKGADNADFVVVGHSTDLGKDKFFLASLHKHGIHAALSGNGTSWHWFEDKLMGAKAALLQMTGNPVVMFADTTDVMFSCSEGEILDRFDATDARVLIGGESQLWPEIDTYFDMQDERDFIERNSAKMDPEIGLRRGATKTPDGIDPRPNKWANGGAWMGRRNDILDYFEELESYLVTNSANQGAGDGFKKACKPYKMSDRTYKERTVAAGFFDDQTCLNRYLMESAGARDSKVKLDMDGSVISPSAART